MKTKAEIAQEIFDFNRESLRRWDERRELGMTGSYGVAFKHTDDLEIMAIVEDLEFEERERQRQRRARMEYLVVMTAIIGNGDKTFGMQEIVER